MSNDKQVPTGADSDIIDFQTFRKKKVEEATLVRGRKPLYMSHGKIALGGDKGHDKKLSDFSERIAKIRMSLDKISALMADLKKLSSHKS